MIRRSFNIKIDHNRKFRRTEAKTVSSPQKIRKDIISYKNRTKLAIIEGTAPETAKTTVRMT